MTCIACERVSDIWFYLDTNRAIQFREQLEQLSYIESELEALEREQESIDLKASALEKKLRGVMGGGNGESE